MSVTANVWILAAIIIEVMGLLAWVAYAATGRIKFAFLFGFNVMLPVAWLFLFLAGAHGWRSLLAIVSVVLYLLNMNTVILFWSRDTAMSKLDLHLRSNEKRILPFLMANATGWLYCLPFYFIARRTAPFDWHDAMAIVVYTAGSFIHVSADLQKRRFKALSENKCRVLTEGLWRYSRHPNYFGDFLIYVGWAVFAISPWAWLSPLTNLAQYLFDAIPKNEKWAAERYKNAWSDYAERTSRLIPWFVQERDLRLRN